MQSIAQITSIQFGILSDKDIMDMSVCEVDKPSLAVEEGSVYDPRMGCVDNEAQCETCNEDIWKCSGHFGHINLNTPIILFYKQTVIMLRLFCFECHRLICTKEELQLQGIKGYDRIVEHLSNKMSFCGRCSEPHPEVRLDTTDVRINVYFKHKNEKTVRNITPVTVKYIFDNIPDEDVEVLGVNPKLFHPRNLVLTKFPVIPTCCRPRMITPDNISDDDLSITLVEIVKNNKLLEKEALSQERYDKIVNEIKFRTLTYCDNTKGKSIHSTNHKPLTGIKERITKKTGHVRQNLMGKRCDRTARTVLGPEPTLKMNEVGIPQEIANMLTVPEYVCPFNIESLTTLVNTPNKASVIIKKNGSKISVPIAQVKRGTILKHGDEIKRNGVTMVVTNCKMEIKEGDVITRNGKPIPTILPEKRHVVLELGDKVERFMKDGDFVLLNRQPTLHRNSMQGMKAVIKPGRTLRMNLSIVTGFNADFDGDEGNVFAEETLEARSELEFLSNAKYNILSAQSNKPEMVIVQDSLLGAYKMTASPCFLTKDQFMHCMMRIEHKYEYHERLAFIRQIRGEPDDCFSTHALFGFILPDDFHYKTEVLTIKHGVIIDGYFDKLSLKGGKMSIIRLLAMEYEPDTTMCFIDNIQFLTNCWLEMFPFSVGIQDCLINDEDKRKEIKDIVRKYFLEANKVATSTDHPHIRESRVNCSLNKAKDIGLRIAKSSLRPDNNFISTVTSGSKGDYFNIAQITGLLGQQNLDGRRPTATIDNKKRTLIHYPRVIVNDVARKYRSRGFVASSFIEGMHPDEMFFHAMTGREGMIKTAMGTATSGYIQRSIVKLNEDLKVEYDGTVRDAKKNIYQFAFGNHGFDPSKVTITSSGHALPVNIERLSERLVGDDEPQFLTIDEIEDIVEMCHTKLFTSFGCASLLRIPDEVAKRIEHEQDSVLRDELNKVKVSASMFQQFKDHIVMKYHTSRATPGDCVGIIGAQSIGERQTQTTLNTFHTAGKLQQSGVGRLEEILNMTKNLKVKTCTIFFKQRYASSDELRQAIGCSITGLFFKDIIAAPPIVTNTQDHDSSQEVTIEFDFNTKVMFTNRINPFKVASVVKEELSDFMAHYTIKPTGLIVHFQDHSRTHQEFLSALNKVLVCGMQGVTASHLDHNGEEWFIVTEGSNIKKMLAHPLIDGKRLYCNDFWEVFECLGIAAARKMLLQDLKKVVCGINELHIQLLVDKMTFKGKPCSITRYTMRSNDCGPLSKATFEESTDILIAAAMKTEIENNAGVSAAIISGNQPRVGTGFMNLLIDHRKLSSLKEEDSEDSDSTTTDDAGNHDAYVPDSDDQDIDYY